jgi:N-acetylmuramoyl-L-alanine amidase
MATTRRPVELPDPGRRSFLRLLLAAGFGIPLAAHAEVGNAAIESLPFANLGGIRYVDLRRVAPLLSARVVQANDRRVILESTALRCTFDAEERAFDAGGFRVFAGDAFRSYRGSVWVSRIDAARAIDPLLRTGMGRPRQGTVQTICIDPGHGGRDPGTQNRQLGLLEKTFTLAVGMRLMRDLQAAGYRVVMTRNSDQFVSLPDRVAFARSSNAHAFVSIHFNATEATQVQGTEQFVLTPQFQRSTSASSSTNVDSVGLPGNRFDLQNMGLGFAMHTAIVRGTRRPDRGLRRARFAVLRDLTCPGVLVEGAYLSNLEEARLIQTPAYQASLSASITAAIRAWTGR